MRQYFKYIRRGAVRIDADTRATAHSIFGKAEESDGHRRTPPERRPIKAH